MVTWSPSKVPYSSNSAQSPSPPASGASPPSTPSSVAPPPPQAVNTSANAALPMSALRTRELLTSCSLSYVVVRVGDPGVLASARLRCGAANPCHLCNRLQVGESNDLRNDPTTVFLPARGRGRRAHALRSEEHTSELQSRGHLVCRLLLEKKNAH